MWKIDTTKTGMLAILNPYQYRIITLVLEKKKNLTTRSVYDQLMDEGLIVSRASVINYLKKLAAAGVIGFEERTGKGGYHRVYSAKLTFEEIIQSMTKTILNSLLNAFPESDYLKYLTE